ncbi:MAG: hypothetical protein CM15mP49_29170 [Actinomycetota bacterium]|nr:MAG: hypothetical protein CM15mP49_29170 [Actinomycetota bacterium]
MCQCFLLRNFCGSFKLIDREPGDIIISSVNGNRRSATASKSSSELASSTATVIVEVIVPSTMSSSAPVTVTVCAVSQFAGVKVSGR